MEKSRLRRNRSPRQLTVETLERREVFSATVFEHNDIGYFLRSAAKRIERYDISGETWLAPITMSALPVAPTVAMLDNDAIFVSAGASVYRLTLQGTSPQLIFTAPNTVRGLHSDGNVLFVNATYDRYTNGIISIDKSTNAVIDSVAPAMSGGYVSVSEIAPGSNRLIGVNQSDIPVYYQDDGHFLPNDPGSVRQAPSSNEFWVARSENEITRAAGTTISLVDQQTTATFGITLDDVTWNDVGLMFATRAINSSISEITAYDSRYLTVYQQRLNHRAIELFANDNSLITFNNDSTSPTGFKATVLTISHLTTPQPGPVVDPVDRTFVPDQVFTANDGSILLFSRANASIFRWDPSLQRYIESIPLIGTPTYASYRSETNEIYYNQYEVDAGLIRKFSLDDPLRTQSPFLRTPTGSYTPTFVDDFLYVPGPYKSYSYTESGELVDTASYTIRTLGLIWSPAAQKMFFSGTGVGSFGWNINGTTYPNEVPGGLAESQSGSSSTTTDSPILALSPDETTMLTSAGKFYSTSTLAQSPLGLANSITGAVWSSNFLFTTTVKNGAVYLQKWNSSNYQLLGEVAVPLLKTVGKLIATNDGQLVVMGKSGEGVFRLAVYDTSFTRIAPTPNIAAPVLDPSGNPILVPAPEDSYSSTRVLSFVQGAISDSDPSPVFGIAVIGVSGTGTWSFGPTPNNTTAPSTVSPTSALLLTSGMYITYRPAPNDESFGTITYMAWDRSMGNEGELFDPTGHIGGSGAFSFEVETAMVDIIPVNDRPENPAGQKQMLPVDEDTTNSSGEFLKDLLGNGFFRDVDENALPGIAITKLDTSVLWQYSINSGNTWLNIPYVGEIGVREAFLLAGDDTTKIRFVPPPNFFGPTKIFFKFWDRTTEVPGTIINWQTNTSTSFSQYFAEFNAEVTSVNDAPFFNPTDPRFFPNRDEDSGSLPIRSAGNFGVYDFDPGSQGIAVTGMTGEGRWQYKATYSAAWTDIPAAAPDNAFLISPSAEVRFVSDLNFNGNATIIYHAWDQSQYAAGNRVDLTLPGVTGAATAFSVDEVSMTQVINPTNDPPTLVLPAVQTTLKNQPLIFSAANGNSIVPDDIDGGSLSVTLKSMLGTLTLANLNGIEVTSGANGTGEMTIQGSIAAVQQALNGLQFLPLLNYVGSARLTIAINDLANGGSGDAKTATSIVSLQIVDFAYIDNDSPAYQEIAGTWLDSGLRGYNGSATRFSASANATARWNSTMPAGHYKISIYVPASTTSSPNAVVTIRHQGTNDTQMVDLRTASGGFVELSGTFTFSGSGDEYVQLSQGSLRGNLRADAIRFTKVQGAYSTRIDNGTPGYAEVGDWYQSSLKGSDNSSTRFAINVAASASWTPSYLPAGFYTVEFYKVANTNSSSSAKVSVVHNGVTDVRSVDLRPGTSGFVDLGTFYFSGGGNEFIKLSQTTSMTLRADAVRLTLVFSAPIVVDEGTSGYLESGLWTASGLTGFGGSSTRYSTSASAAATWTLPILPAGNYRVEFYKVVHPSSTTNAKVSVAHSGQVEQYTLDLTAGTAGFVDLGVFAFDGVSEGYIRLSQQTAGLLRADAVRLTRIG